MAPAPLSPELEQLVAYFQACGLAQARATEVVRNSKTSALAKSLFDANDLEHKHVNDKQALFALQIAKDGVKLTDDSRNYALAAVLDERLKTADQVKGLASSVAS